MKRIFMLLIVMIFGICFVGCNNGEKEIENSKLNEELILKTDKDFIKINNRLYVKTEDKKKDKTTGDIEMISNIVEENFEQMIEIPIDYYSFAMSSVHGLPICLNYPDNDVIYECITDAGSFDYCEETTNTIVKISEKIFWCPEKTKDSTKHAYIDIIVKKDNYIVGYAVIEIVKKENAYIFTPELLKSCVFPKISGQNQNISDEIIEALISIAKI